MDTEASNVVEEMEAESSHVVARKKVKAVRKTTSRFELLALHDRRNIIAELGIKFIEEVPLITLSDVTILLSFLSDRAPNIRLKVMKTFYYYLDDLDDVMPGFVGRMIEKEKRMLLVLANDRPPKNSVAAIELLSMCFSLFPSTFEIKDHKSVSRLVYHESELVRLAAAEFFMDTMPPDITRTMSVIQFLILYYESVEYCPENLARAFFGAMKELHDYRTIVQHLEDSDGNDDDARIATLLMATVYWAEKHDAVEQPKKKKRAFSPRRYGYFKLAKTVIKPKMVTLSEKFGNRSPEWRRALCFLLKILYADDLEEFKSFKQYYIQE